MEVDSPNEKLFQKKKKLKPPLCTNDVEESMVQMQSSGFLWVSCSLALICGEDDKNYMAQWHMLGNKDGIMGGRGEG